MKFCELVKKGIVGKKALDDMYVNVLDVIKNEEFSSQASGCYRARAIKRVLKLKVDFCSEINTLHELVTQLLSVKCPQCHRKMELLNVSGNMSSESLGYKCCKCKCGVDITLPSDSIRVGYDR
jgi:hypothetical protein